MSRSHQQHRRRAYGRRRHEVRERRIDQLEPLVLEPQAAATSYRDEQDESFVPFGMPGPRLRWSEAR